MNNASGIIYADESDTGITSALFGRATESAQQYISDSVNKYTSLIADNTGNMVNTIKDRFNEIRSSQTVQRIENMRARINSVWQTNNIRKLSDVAAIQQAPVAMQRWILAHPAVHRGLESENLEGYDGAYKSIKPGGISKDTNFDERRVINSVVKKDITGSASYSNFYEPNVSDTDILNSIEKIAIFSTWDTLEQVLDDDTNVDPTSVWNSTRV